jgi:hypothetical protein
VSRRAFLAGVLALLGAAVVCAETVRIQRYLASLQLGDTLDVVRRIYPPARDWSSHLEPGGEVRRYEIGRAFAKSFPVGVETLRLGLRRNRLVHVQLIYDLDTSRKKPVDELVVDYALAYGEPRRTGRAFWWSDGDTILRVSEVAVPVLDAGREAAELRTSAELMSAEVYGRR